jgi:hypothetical protein
MSDKTVDGLMALRAETLARLSGNPDFISLQVLDEAIAKLIGRQPDHNARTLNALAGNVYTDNSPLNALTRWMVKHGKVEQGERPSIAGGAVRVLASVGRPMSLVNLVSQMHRHGFIDDKDESTAASVSSVLSRDDRFKSVQWNGRRRWWLAEAPLPADPQTEGGHDET